ncbi:AfsR/SARP family transcriptional regulator [Geodermatophilus sp. SYSU D00710]
MGGASSPLLSFHDLGPLEVRRAGVPVALGGARLTAALSLLLVHVGRHVSVDALTQAMWGEESPARSSSTLDSHVWRLRRALEPDRAPGVPSEVLVREPGGYRLVVDPETVDSRRFTRLAGEARTLLSSGRAEEACRAAEEALALWRGRPYPTVADAPWATAGVAHLTEVRDQAREVLAEALLASGAPERALLELGPPLAEAPLRERLWALRMLAQHRLGRPEEALRSYRQARAVFLGELGLEPGPDLRELQRRILAGDPAPSGRAAPPSPPPAAPPPAAPPPAAPPPAAPPAAEAGPQPVDGAPAQPAPPADVQQEPAEPPEADDDPAGPLRPPPRPGGDDATHPPPSGHARDRRSSADRSDRGPPRTTGAAAPTGTRRGPTRPGVRPPPAGTRPRWWSGPRR